LAAVQLHPRRRHQRQLITLLATLAVYQLLRIWQTALSWPRTLLLGITIGLAALTKNAGVLLLIYALIVFSLKYAAETPLFSLRRARRYAPHMGGLVLLVVLIAGWLWLRNQTIYGDWTATNQFIAVAGGDRGYTIGQVLAESSGLWLSLFAVFGWFNLTAPEWVYLTWNGLFVTALLGLAIGGIGHWRRNPLRFDLSLRGLQALLAANWLPGLLLAGWLCAVYAGLMLFMLQTEAAQGRLLFPAILPIVIGLTAGWGAWGVRARPFLFTLAPLTALLTTLFSLFAVIRPAYALPQPVEMVPKTAVPVHETLYPGVTLRAISQPEQNAQPGDLVTFTLYWEAETPPEKLVELKFELFGQDFATPLAAVHTYHGRGLFPPAYWNSGTIYADYVTVRLPQEIDLPLLARSSTRLIEPETDESEGIIAGEVKIVPETWPEAGSPLVTFGETAALTAVELRETAVDPGDTVTIDLQWHILAPPGKALTTLVHLASPGQPPLAQADGPPRGGSYPTTVWAAGETFADRYLLTIPADLPPGRYPLWIGLYQPADFVRETAVQGGMRLPNDQFQIGEVEVRP
jgi:hypothetical protein